MLEPNTYTKAKEMGAFSPFSLVNRLENSLGMIVSGGGGLKSVSWLGGKAGGCCGNLKVW